jgi:hypothetical protein
MGSVKERYFPYLAAVAGGMAPEGEAKGATFFERIKDVL